MKGTTNMEKEFVTFKEAMVLLNRTRDMVNKLSQAGKLKKYKAMGTVYFEKEEILKLIEPKRV
jgi:soluble cytochrome b562